jgi:hypothetical protein
MKLHYGWTNIAVGAIMTCLAYGGEMPLCAVLARENFGARIMGAAFDAAVTASSLALALKVGGDIRHVQRL